MGDAAPKLFLVPFLHRACSQCRWPDGNLEAMRSLVVGLRASIDTSRYSDDSRKVLRSKLRAGIESREIHRE